MLLIDAHVHMYPCFDPAALLNAAEENFRVQAGRLGAGEAYTGILLLTERSADKWYSHLAAHAAGAEQPCPGAGNRLLFPTLEQESLVLENREGKRIFLVAGRQVVSREGLEVLALLTRGEFADGRPLAELIAAVRDTGGVPVIPWAFGKWFGARGRFLRGFIREQERGFFLGDNGGRPFCIPVSPLLRQEMEQNRPVLSGSDPLPIPGEERRAGSFGVYVAAGLDEQAPAASLKAIIAAGDNQLKSYGRPMGFGRFLRNQWLLLRGGNV